MRANPKFKTEAAITEMGVGEALVSFLDEKGRPTVVERVYVLPPASRIGPATPEERKAVMAASPVAGTYDKVVDRESAYEKLKARAAAAAPAAAAGSTTAQPAGGGVLGGLSDILFGSTGPRGGKREGMVDAMAKSAARSVGSSLAREITRGVLGSLLGGKRR
jgi:DNA helicase HerA-like ATPase